jgi:hypothetical protein
MRASKYAALGFDYVVANGVPNEVGRRAEIQFAVSAGAMRFHRLHADMEDGRDLLVGVTLRN